MPQAPPPAWRWDAEDDAWVRSLQGPEKLVRDWEVFNDGLGELSLSCHLRVARELGPKEVQDAVTRAWTSCSLHFPLFYATIKTGVADPPEEAAFKEYAFHFKPFRDSQDLQSRVQEVVRFQPVEGGGQKDATRACKAHHLTLTRRGHRVGDITQGGMYGVRLHVFAPPSPTRTVPIILQCSHSYADGRAMFAVLHYFRLAFESPHLFRASQPLQVGCELKRLVPGCRDLCSSSTAKQGDHEKQQIEEYIANAMAETIAPPIAFRLDSEALPEDLDVHTYVNASLTVQVTEQLRANLRRGGFTMTQGVQAAILVALITLSVEGEKEIALPKGTPQATGAAFNYTDVGGVLSLLGQRSKEWTGIDTPNGHSATFAPIRCDVGQAYQAVASVEGRKGWSQAMGLLCSDVQKSFLFYKEGAQSSWPLNEVWQEQYRPLSKLLQAQSEGFVPSAEHAVPSLSSIGDMDPILPCSSIDSNDKESNKTEVEDLDFYVRSHPNGFFFFYFYTFQQMARFTVVVPSRVAVSQGWEKVQTRVLEVLQLFAESP